MKKYKNRSGQSGVVAYESGPDYIRVQFTESDQVYRYSYRSAGKQRVEQMKELAESGRGLSSYISRYVRDLYD